MIPRVLPILKACLHAIRPTYRSVYSSISNDMIGRTEDLRLDDSVAESSYKPVPMSNSNKGENKSKQEV